MTTDVLTDTHYVFGERRQISPTLEKPQALPNPTVLQRSVLEPRNHRAEQQMLFREYLEFCNRTKNNERYKNDQKSNNQTMHTDMNLYLKASNNINVTTFYRWL